MIGWFADVGIHRLRVRMIDAFVGRDSSILKNWSPICTGVPCPRVLHTPMLLPRMECWYKLVYNPPPPEKCSLHDLKNIHFRAFLKYNTQLSIHPSSLELIFRKTVIVMAWPADQNNLPDISWELDLLMDSMHPLGPCCLFCCPMSTSFPDPQSAVPGPNPTRSVSASGNVHPQTPQTTSTTVSVN